MFVHSKFHENRSTVSKFGVGLHGQYCTCSISFKDVKWDEKIFTLYLCRQYMHTESTERLWKTGSLQSEASQSSFMDRKGKNRVCLVFDSQGSQTSWAT